MIINFNDQIFFPKVLERGFFILFISQLKVYYMLSSVIWKVNWPVFHCTENAVCAPEGEDTESVFIKIPHPKTGD